MSSYRITTLIHSKSIQKLCSRPYPNHKKGCPNYNERKTCPPHAPYIEDVLDMTKSMFLVWVRFNLQRHRKQMKDKHPTWSERQCNCCLYWQGKVNKMLRQRVEDFQKIRMRHGLKELSIWNCPEAMGVNLTSTMYHIGIQLEWSPIKHSAKNCITWNN